MLGVDVSSRVDVISLQYHHKHNMSVVEEKGYQLLCLQGVDIVTQLKANKAMKILSLNKAVTHTSITIPQVALDVDYSLCMKVLNLLQHQSPFRRSTKRYHLPLTLSNMYTFFIMY